MIIWVDSIYEPPTSVSSVAASPPQLSPTDPPPIYLAPKHWFSNTRYLICGWFISIKIIRNCEWIMVPFSTSSIILLLPRLNFNGSGSFSSWKCNCIKPELNIGISECTGKTRGCWINRIREMIIYIYTEYIKSPFTDDDDPKGGLALVNFTSCSFGEEGDCGGEYWRNIISWTRRRASEYQISCSNFLTRV